MSDTENTRYGGRGISIGDDWKSFESFFRDMGKRPSPDHSIERKNNSGNYCKDNCIWTTRKPQARNRRDNVPVTIDGRTQCVAAWAEELGLNVKRIYERISDGWDPARAVLTPKPK